MAELFLHYRNEGANLPLIVPVAMLVNTPAPVLFSHIRENSKNCNKWLKQIPAHNGVALLCGSGPSLEENLHDIRALQKAGATVFALNAAAGFLHSNGIMPDFQVMIDAKEETVSLIGPAREYLFGSTVDPKCFEIKPDATLFHIQVDDDDLQEDIDQLAPDDYSMLSTAVSVGVVSLALVFTMGFRDIHCYGYDSSHKGEESHVVRQKMNDAVPCMDVEFCGKHYLTSLPMKLQAERFMQVANLLRHNACHIGVHGYGLLPDMFHAPFSALSEKEKYTRMWSMVSYRDYSPAERICEEIMKHLPKEGQTLDFGCGTGRAAAILSRNGYNVHMMDFAPNCLDEEACDLPFTEVDLTEKIPLKGDQGYCCDVMEHIPTENVDAAIQNIMEAAPKVFFQISTIPDTFGVTIGHELHLTVQAHSWWKALFERLGYQIEWEQETTDAALFVIRRADA